MRRALADFSPHYVINCASTGDVDRCEREPEWAFAVNELGPRLLTRECIRTGAEMVHTSTDYVFDGAKQGFYTQEDEPRPESVYGQSKLAGEVAVREEAERFYIIRTSWLFGVGGKNFGSRVLEYASKNPRLKGVVDQTSIPNTRRIWHGGSRRSSGSARTGFITEQTVASEPGTSSRSWRWSSPASAMSRLNR